MDLNPQPCCKLHVFGFLLVVGLSQTAKIGQLPS